MSAPRPRLIDHLSAALEAAEPELVGRLGESPQAHLELVALARDARQETDTILVAAVQSARRAGCTWEQVGEVLGMSRQAAHQRFGQDSAAAEPERQDALPVTERRTLAPVTAFTEMAVLARVAQFGWHAVDCHVLRFTMERDTHRWEHRRHLSWHQPPDGDGWTPVGRGWFPWAYYARPLPEAAIEVPQGYDPFQV